MRNDEENRSTPDAAFLVRTQKGLTHTLKSQQSMHYLPSMIGGKEEAILLINTLVNAKNTGSVDQLYKSQSSMSSM